MKDDAYQREHDENMNEAGRHVENAKSADPGQQQKNAKRK
jgi:hypothetical protein